MAVARTRTSPLATGAVLILAGSLIMAAGAQVSVNVPFSPVPVTGQTLGIALVVALLGTRRAVLAMFAYLAEGALGAPVFAGHHGGAVWLVASSAGYLWSFPIAALVIGSLFERGLRRSFAGRFAAVLVGTAVVLACGAAWLAVILGGVAPAIAAGVAPFICGDVLKAAIAALVAPALVGFRSALSLR